MMAASPTGHASPDELRELIDTFDDVVEGLEQLIKQGALTFVIDASTGTCIERDELLSGWEKLRVTSQALWHVLDGVKDRRGHSVEAGYDSPRSRLNLSIYSLQKPEHMGAARAMNPAVETCRGVIDELRERLYLTRSTEHTEGSPTAEPRRVESVPSRVGDGAARLFVFDPPPTKLRHDLLVLVGSKAVAGTLSARDLECCEQLGSQGIVKLEKLDKYRKQLNHLRKCLAQWGILTERSTSPNRYVLKAVTPLSVHRASGSLNRGRDLKTIVRALEREFHLGQH